MIRRMLQWLATPIVALAMTRLRADKKAESERAELWRKRCTAFEEQQGAIIANYRAQIDLLNAQIAALQPGAVAKL